MARMGYQRRRLAAPVAAAAVLLLLAAAAVAVDARTQARAGKRQHRPVVRESPTLQRAFRYAAAAPLRAAARGAAFGPRAQNTDWTSDGRGRYSVYSCLGLSEVADAISADTTWRGSYTVTLKCKAPDTNADISQYTCFDGATPYAAVFTSRRRTTITVQADTAGRTATCTGTTRPLLYDGPAVDIGESLPFLTFGSADNVDSQNDPALWSTYVLRDINIDGQEKRPGIAASQATSLAIDRVNIVNVRNTYEAAALLLIDAPTTLRGKSRTEPLLIQNARVSIPPSTALSFPGAGGAIGVTALETASNFNGRYLYFFENGAESYGGVFYIRKIYQSAMTVNFESTQFISSSANDSCSVGIVLREDGWIESVPDSRQPNGLRYVSRAGGGLNLRVTKPSSSAAAFQNNSPELFQLCGFRDRYTLRDTDATSGATEQVDMPVGRVPRVTVPDIQSPLPDGAPSFDEFALEFLYG